MSLTLLTFPKSGARADVRVDVRARIVQVQREHPIERSVVPIAATDREPINAQPLLPFNCKRLHPSAYHTANFIIQPRPIFIFLKIQVPEIFCHPDLRPQQVNFCI